MMKKIVMQCAVIFLLLTYAKVGQAIPYSFSSTINFMNLQLPWDSPDRVRSLNMSGVLEFGAVESTDYEFSETDGRLLFGYEEYAITAGSVAWLGNNYDVAGRFVLTANDSNYLSLQGSDGFGLNIMSDDPNYLYIREDNLYAETFFLWGSLVSYYLGENEITPMPDIYFDGWSDVRIADNFNLTKMDDPAPVPEPASLLLFVAGLVGFMNRDGAWIVIAAGHRGGRRCGTNIGIAPPNHTGA